MKQEFGDANAVKARFEFDRRNKMNKDDAREAAWKRLEINEWRLKLRSTTQQRKAGELLNAMFDAGYASVDRRAIVEEAKAFKRVAIELRIRFPVEIQYNSEFEAMVKRLEGGSL